MFVVFEVFEQVVLIKSTILSVDRMILEVSISTINRCHGCQRSKIYRRHMKQMTADQTDDSLMWLMFLRSLGFLEVSLAHDAIETPDVHWICRRPGYWPLALLCLLVTETETDNPSGTVGFSFGEDWMPPILLWKRPLSRECL